jgi:hypothetical protein
MEEEDFIIAKWAQEDVGTLYSLLNNNNKNCLMSVFSYFVKISKFEMSVVPQ